MNMFLQAMCSAKLAKLSVGSRRSRILLLEFHARNLFVYLSVETDCIIMSTAVHADIRDMEGKVPEIMGCLISNPPVPCKV